MGDFRWVEVKHRQFPARMVRDCCTAIYGRRISNDAWSQWRSWGRVPRRVRYMDFDQFCFLAAIAYVRSQQRRHGHERVELVRSQIEAIANSLELQSELKRLLDLVDCDRCIGKDAPLALATRGIKVSLRTLYRNIPAFNVGTVYKIDYLAELAIA